jgi:ATP-dependent Clp protease ATP-binding subunit ClpX
MISSGARRIIYIGGIDKISKNRTASRTGCIGRIAAGPSHDLEGCLLRSPKGRRKHPQRIYSDRYTILFICGGAFVGLEKLIEQRIGGKTIGFGAEIKTKKERDMGEVLREVQPEDLLRFGLIPEFIGRLPVIATLDELNMEALVDILKKPKNALVKQYQKLFEFENVKLKFTEGALMSIAKEAVKRKSGARGLRSILENIMLDVMYEIPSQNNVRECIISEEVVVHHENPILLYEKEAEVA